MDARAPGRLVRAPDGAQVHVETSGLPDGPTVVLTHGWGLNSRAWGDAKQALGGRYRVVVWDLPGLGRSKLAPDGRLSIDRMAQALGVVVESCGPAPVLLVGHSIGGMTSQTFWRAAAEAARSRVVGMVLVNTTHQNPLRTMWLRRLWTTLEGPLLRPLMHVVIGLSPLVWLSSWQGYLSGSNHIAVRLTGFGRFATRGQVELVTRLACKASPRVQAKGNLAMFDWRMTDDLPSIAVPTLVLAGGRPDIVTQVDASRAITDAIPGSRLALHEGCGHMGYLERADSYMAEITGFAEQAFSRAPGRA